jgi:hypothetical protein
MSNSNVAAALAILRIPSPTPQATSSAANSGSSIRLASTTSSRLTYDQILARRAFPLERSLSASSGGAAFAAAQAARIRGQATQPESASRASALCYRLYLFAGEHDIPIVLSDREAFNNLVAAFIDELCYINSSAASIHTNISLIFSHVCRKLGGKPWGPSDVTFWRDIKAGLLEQYGAPRQVPNATTAETLHKLWNGLVANMPAPWPRWATDVWELLLTSYHFTLRPSEFLGPSCDFRKGNLSFGVSPEGRRFASLTLRISKTLLRKHQVGSNTEKALASEVDGPLDAVRLLERRCMALPADPDAPIFPSPRGDYPTNAEFNADLRKLCGVAGVDPTFTARGARRGHRTDMGANSSASETQINLLGRWGSTRASSLYQDPSIDLLKCLPTSI